MTNRRHFMKSALAATALFSTTEWNWARAQDVNTFIHDEFAVWGRDSLVCRTSLRDQRTTEILIPGFKAHGFMKNPLNKNQIITVEKWRSRLVKVDFVHQKNTKMVFCEKNRRFYGHTCLLPDNKSFAVITADNDSKIAYFSVYDIESLVRIEDHPIGRGTAHEIGRLPDNQSYVIAMTGWIPVYVEGSPINFKKDGLSSLIYFDYSTKTVKNQQYLYNEFTTISHLKVCANGSVVAVSDFFNAFYSEIGVGSIFKSKLNDKLRQIDLPENVSTGLKGELLSIEVNEAQGVFAVTCPAANKTLVLNIESGHVVAVIPTNTYGIGWSTDYKSLYLLNRDTHYKKEVRCEIPQSPSPLFNIKQFSDQVARPSSHILIYA